MKLARDQAAPRGGRARGRAARVQRKALDGRGAGSNQARANATLERQADESADRALRGETNVSRILTPATPAKYDAPASAAEALPTPVRAQMENTFGADFNEVRVHRDGVAQAAARREGAKAFTAGRDIFFGAGQFEPNGVEGKRLLVHELAHVLQQTGRRTSPTLIRASVREGNGDIQLREARPPEPSFVVPAQRYETELAGVRRAASASPHGGGAPALPSDDDDELARIQPLRVTENT